jgi:anti-sigma B factor antagonist
MKMLLESRPVGDVLIVQCQGRIVAGPEVLKLHAYVGDSIAKYGDIVLLLEQVEFIDSSGLGALVRLLQAARSKKGDLKLSRIPPNIRKTLEMTHLLAQFESYESVEEAITAAYLGSRYSPGIAGDARPRVLCIYESSDVCTFLRELLCSAGYNALTTSNIDDAKILLKATKAKLVVLSARLQSVYGKPTRQALQQIDPAISFVMLDEDFASQDPGEAAEKLLNGVRDAAMAGKAV